MESWIFADLHGHDTRKAHPVLQILDALVKLGLQTEASPKTLLEAAQSLHSAAEPTDEQMTRAGALLHRLNTLAQEGAVPYQDLQVACISHLDIHDAMKHTMCIKVLYS